MAERVLVFCREPVMVTPRELVEELRDADLETLAEVLELEEGEAAAVEEMWKCFRADGDALDGLELFWHREQRPIQLRAAPPMEEEREELLGGLKPETPGLERVRTHLENTKTVVELEMGVHGARHLAATIAETLAFFIAEKSDGLVLFYGREFAAPDDRGRPLLMLRG